MTAGSSGGTAAGSSDGTAAGSLTSSAGTAAGGTAAGRRLNHGPIVYPGWTQVANFTFPEFGSCGDGVNTFDEDCEPGTSSFHTAQFSAVTSRLRLTVTSSYCGSDRFRISGLKAGGCAMPPPERIFTVFDSDAQGRVGFICI